MESGQTLWRQNSHTEQRSTALLVLRHMTESTSAPPLRTLAAAFLEALTKTNTSVIVQPRSHETDRRVQNITTLRVKVGMSWDRFTGFQETVRCLTSFRLDSSLFRFEFIFSLDLKRDQKINTDVETVDRNNKTESFWSSWCWNRHYYIELWSTSKFEKPYWQTINAESNVQFVLTRHLWESNHKWTKVDY